MTFRRLKKLYHLEANHKKYRIRKKNKNRIKRLHDKWWEQIYEIAKWDYDMV